MSSRFPPPFPTYPRPTAPAPVDEREVDIPPWSGWSVPAGVAIGLGLWIVTSVIVAAVASATGSSVSHPSPGISLAQDFLSDLSFVSGALILTVVMSRARAADYGYRRVWPPLAIGAFVAAAIGYYVISLIYASIVSLHGSAR